jgi:hypothetical protein
MRTAKPDQLIVPKLESLSFSDIDLFPEPLKKLLDILEERRTHGVGLKGLTIWSCGVGILEFKEELEDLVEKIIWEDVEEMDLDYEPETEEETTSGDETEIEEEVDSEDEY